jgi:hypothetical protein
MRRATFVLFKWLLPAAITTLTVTFFLAVSQRWARTLGLRESLVAGIAILSIALAVMAVFAYGLAAHAAERADHHGPARSGRGDE